MYLMLTYFKGGQSLKVNKKKMALIGLAASTLFAVSGCGGNEASGVYGPPIEPREVTEQQINDPVYGPPEASGDTEDENTTEITTEITTESNELQTDYGPPLGD